MQRKPLAEFAARRHAWTAQQLGMSQGALSKAIREGRQIFVFSAADGSLAAVEEKPFPGQRRADEHNSKPAGTIEVGAVVPVHPSSAPGVM